MNEDNVTPEIQAFIAHARNRTRAFQTQRGYLSCLRTIGKLMVENWEVYCIKPIDVDCDGNIAYYPADYLFKGKPIPKFVLPMDAGVAMTMFCHLSQKEQPSRKRQGNHAIDLTSEVVDPTNPSRNTITMASGSLINFISAVKWWHGYEDTAKGKKRVAFPENVSEQLRELCNGYKKEVGLKRKRGVMAASEGKEALSQAGYEALCRYMYKLKPTGHSDRWSETIFFNLFLRLQCATIGRSDNIGALFCDHFDWDGDSISVKFVSTKSDQEGEISRRIDIIKL